MPELPEVETICRGLRPKLEGQVLRRVGQRRADLRFPLPKAFISRLSGRRVLQIERRAKYILIHLDDGWTLIIHLGMSGRMTVIEAAPPPAAGPHDHIEFLTAANVTIRYNDTRRFGFMDLVKTKLLAEHPMLKKLGPEPLSDEFNAAKLRQALHSKRTSIKAALLDQRIVAGLGNIYVCESLFRAKISPRRSAYTVMGQRSQRITEAIQNVLNSAIAAGGSSLRDYVQTDGKLGYFQHQWRVYGREGETCGQDGCPGIIRRIVQSGRSTFYCANHQR